MKIRVEIFLVSYPAFGLYKCRVANNEDMFKKELFMHCSGEELVELARFDNVVTPLLELHGVKSIDKTYIK